NKDNTTNCILDWPLELQSLYSQKSNLLINNQNNYNKWLVYRGKYRGLIVQLTEILCRVKPSHLKHPSSIFYSPFELQYCHKNEQNDENIFSITTNKTKNKFECVFINFVYKSKIL